VVPPEYERYVIVKDRVFPNKEDYFGYNDYTGFVPIDGRTSNDGYLGSITSTSPIRFLLAPEVSKDLQDSLNHFYSGWVHSTAKDRTLCEFLYMVGPLSGSPDQIVADALLLPVTPKSAHSHSVRARN